MFESFNVPALHVSYDAIYYLGYRHTGLVVCLETDYMYAVPVYYGSLVMEALVHVPYGMNDIITYLSKLIDYDSAILADLLHTLTFIKSDAAVMEASVKYTLPDGEILTLGKEVVSQCWEPLFDPYLLDLPESTQQMSIIDMIVESINKAPEDLYQELYKNIIKAGKLPQGFSERIIQDLTNNDTLNIKANKYTFLLGTHPRIGANSPIRTLPIEIIRKIFSFLPYISKKFKPEKIWVHNDMYNRNIGPWSGADACHESVAYITKEMYDESGPSIVNRVCLIY